MKIRFKFIVFCVIGAGACLMDWIFFNIFYSFGFGFIVSIGLAWIISMTFNFTTNRKVTFSASKFSIRGQLPKWLFIYFIAFLARVIIGEWIIRVIGESSLNANIAFLAGLLVSVPTSFFGSLWVFKKKN